MPCSLTLLALVGFISSSAAAPTASRLVPRSRFYQDLANLRASPASVPTFHSFEEKVDFHLGFIKPDLDQKFWEWKQDMKSEYTLQKTELGLTLYESTTISKFEAEVANARTQRKNHPEALPAQMSSFIQGVVLFWMKKRLPYLQADVRNQLYEALVNWSKAIHGSCKAKYTPYPAGIVSVMVQIQTVWDWHRGVCDPIVYNDQVLSLLQMFDNIVNFSSLQLLCSAAMKDCKFAIGDVMPDAIPSKYISS